MQKPQKISKNIYKIEKEKDMRVPALIYANEKIINAISEDKTIEQIKNTACLPGIIKNALLMPDAHQGYGFPIGTVATFDAEEGIIVPGGVGYDINCGVRLLSTDIKKEDFVKKRKELIEEINNVIPSGVGYKNKKNLTEKELDNFLKKGSRQALEEGLATKEDITHTEENGMIEDADPEEVSERAKARGKGQLGTLGAGNHFIEFQETEEILDKEKARKWGIKENTISLMIHCGSRGLGHQIASDYIRQMEKEFDHSRPLPDRELIWAPIKSDISRRYIKAMNCAINFAFANRQIIMHRIRKILNKHFPGHKNHLVYDVAHNIAKFEEQEIEGIKKKICIHRKGATRAFFDLPVILPGSMGTASFLLVGTKEAEALSFNSTAHGAGRTMSRSKAKKTIDSRDTIKNLEKKGIEIYSKTKTGISEESPLVYKDIEDIARISEELNIARKVARLRPLLVIKG